MAGERSVSGDTGQTEGKKSQGAWLLGANEKHGGEQVTGDVTSGFRMLRSSDEGGIAHRGETALGLRIWAAPDG